MTVHPVSEGTLSGGLPYLAMGSGPPLVVFPGFAPTHGNPTGALRRTTLAPLRLLSNYRRVHLVSRRPGVRPGTSIADFAADYADALAANFTVPVDITGFSGGGAVALQLAADHPHLVRRLIVAGIGHTLSPFGKTAMRDWATRAQADQHPMLAMTALVSNSPLLRPLAPTLMWLTDRANRGKDLSDGIVMSTALTGFDCRDRLSDITAATLLVAGDRDPFLTPAIIDRTIRKPASARLALYRRRGHFGTFLGNTLSRDIERFLADGEPGPK